jgi:hypothetical protein
MSRDRQATDRRYLVKVDPKTRRLDGSASRIFVTTFHADRRSVAP